MKNGPNERSLFPSFGPYCLSMKLFSEKYIGYTLITPTLIIFVVFVIIPFALTILLSFFKWNGLLPPEYIGLENFVYLINKPRIYKSFLNSSVFILFYSFLPIIVSLLLAGVIFRFIGPASSIFRTILFLPQVTPSVVIGFAWIWMYSINGPINALLTLLGLSNLKRPWLGDFDTALISIGFIGTWMTIGFTLILFLAGISKINNEIFEAASIDGANIFQKFRYITIPGIRQEILVALIITLITALRSFDTVFITTRGGPGNQTIVPGLFIYKLAFQEGKIGQASAIATILSILIFIITYLVSKVYKPETNG